jgi:Skp family chaperone for outer membrane proteins
MKIMKRVLPALLLILAAGTAAVAQDVPRIAVFDPQRVSEETEEGARIQARLTAFRNQKQTELTAMQTAVTALQDQLVAQALSLSPERKQALEIEIQKKALDFQSTQEAAAREMQLEINSAQTRFQDQLLAVVEQFGQSEGFDLILDRSLVAWAAPPMDVTTALVDRFNQMVQSPTATPAPAEAGSGQ